MYNAEIKQEEVSLGEEMDILVLKGKGDSIISRMKDGRVILFNRENPIFPELRPELHNRRPPSSSRYGGQRHKTWIRHGFRIR